MDDKSNKLIPLPGLDWEENRFRALLFASSAYDHVLIRGERGVGKSYFIKVFKESYPDLPPNIIHLNCASIYPDLADSELFGYVKGAFTGATESRAGFIKSAEQRGKVLILEELNSLPIAIQAKLLVYMETFTFYPVGGRDKQSAKLRIVATMNFENNDTNRKSIRYDLVDRFKIVANVPPINLRREDIFHLIATRYPNLVLSGGMLLGLYGKEWPGNLRDIDRILFELSAVGFSVASGYAFPKWCNYVRKKIIQISSKDNFNLANAQCFGNLLSSPKLRIVLSESPVKRTLKTSLSPDRKVGALSQISKYPLPRILVIDGDKELYSFDARVVTTMFEIFFGKNTLTDIGHVETSEPFNGESYNYLLTLKKNSKKIATGASPLGMEMASVTQEVLDDFIDTCIQICELSAIENDKELPQGASDNINASQVADFLLQNNDQFKSVLTELFRTSKQNIITERLGLFTSTINRWKKFLEKGIWPPSGSIK